MSGGSRDDSGGALIGEGGLVVLSICALIIAAAILPPVDGAVLLPLAGGNAGAGGLDGGGEPGQPTTTSSGGQSDSSGGGQQPGSSAQGSPRGSTLSEPPESMAVGSSRSNPQAVPKIPLFTIESSRTGYWRQAVYDTYTGSAWNSGTELQPYAGVTPNDDRTVGTDVTSYEVTLLQSGSSLPTLWQLETANVTDTAGEIRISTGGALRSQQPLPRGTSYVAQSAAPPRDPELLDGAGRNYPAELRQQYTQLPEDTPGRVETFTTDLTADAETPYETARTVKRWLEESKTYSLNASHDTGDPVADQFIFEMDRGYCQYFATAMVAMLRSQDVPARYVVGFADGTPVGENRYLVTSDTGHAWVEVYFPDVGWVRFDPTPAGSLPVQNPQPPYNISLNRTAVAGATVDVAVKKDDEPVIGAPVYVGGERTGWTGADGTVTTQLPYTADVTVTAQPPGGRTKHSDERTAATADSEPAVGIPPDPGRSSRTYKLSPPDVLLQSNASSSGCTVENETAVRCQSDTAVSVNVTGSPVRGTSVLVSAAIRGVPVRNATVRFNGSTAGYTDGSGEYTLSLAGVTTGPHEVIVERQAVSGTTTIRVTEPATPTTTATPTPGPPDRNDPQSINLSVTPQFGVALPLAGARINATRSGMPVTNTTVYVAGSARGRPGPNGTLSVTVPLQRSVSVVAVGPDGTRTRTTVAGLYRNAAGVLGGLVVLAGGSIVLLRRLGLTPSAVAVRVQTAVRRVSGFVIDRLVGLTTGILRAGRGLRRLLGRVQTFLVKLPSRIATRGVAALALLDPRRLVSALWRWLSGLLAALKRQHTDPEDTVDGRGSAASDAETGGAPPTLRNLWGKFVHAVRPPRLTTKTPEEVATYAINRGIPAPPVEALTRIYREAEYGTDAPEESHLEAAREAFHTIQDAINGGDR